MFGVEMLDVAIGLVFLYLLLSLITSALNEILQIWLKWRAVDLHKGISQLLTDGSGTGLAKRFYEHPLVGGLFDGKYVSPARRRKWFGFAPAARRLPSYIPAPVFATTLIDLVVEESRFASPPLASPPLGYDMDTLHAAIKEFSEQPGNEQAGRALLALAYISENNLDTFQNNVEDWYNSAMDRVSGWYKRRTQVVLFVLGIVVAALINADTLVIGYSLANDDELRNSLVAAAQTYIENPPENALTGLTDVENSNVENSDVENGNVENSDADTGGEPSSDAADTEPANDSSVADPLNEVKEINTLGLPLGWNRLGCDAQRAVAESEEQSEPESIQWRDLVGDRCKDSVPEWGLVVVGWLLTAVAISFGAPFWFDLLNKFLVVRSTVKPREKSPEEGSED